jgi:hypothetical protein
VTVSFDVQKLFNLIRFHLSILSPNCFVHMWSDVFPIFSWSNFTVSDLIFISLMHFEMMLV